MKRRVLDWSCVFCLSVVLAACGADSGDDDGGTDADAGPGEVDAGAPDAGATADAGPPDAGPLLEDDAGAAVADVEWLIEPEPLTIDADLALDYFYSYSLSIDGDPLEYDLRLERCVQIAGEAERCESSPRDNLPGESGVRWGIDPSGYAVGENRYSFRLVLERAGALVDEDAITLVVTVTSCETCGGG